LSDFSKQERSDWLSALIEAISAESPRLTEMDMETFASKVAWRAPAPIRQNEIKQGDENGL
jgi:hypothetical protein